MKILVCIKQISDLESRFQVNASGSWYDERDLAFRMNEFDEYAVEQAVQLKEQLGGAPEITVLSVGSERVVKSIRTALAMGCDRGVHIQDPSPHTKDPWQIASIIVAFAQDQGFDLIFTGMQSQDRGSAQVGVTVAELLGIPCTTAIVGFTYHSGVIDARRELEGGLKGIVQLKTPALVTCQTGLNVPRYPTLPGILKAKKKEMVTLLVDDLSREQGLIETDAIYVPDRKGAGVVLEGDMNDMADQLIDILKAKTALFR